MKIDKDRLLNDLAYVFGDKEYFEAIKSVVESQPECDGWISVDDDMPKETYLPLFDSNYSNYVFGYCKRQKILTIARTINKKWIYKNIWGSKEKMQEDVTYWMPLPEPPKENKDDRT